MIFMPSASIRQFLWTQCMNHLTQTIDFKNLSLTLGQKPVVMGILNATPDSFSDGGDHLDLEAALNSAKTMIEDGASILDVGGESTRPGADKVSQPEEETRVLPLIKALAEAHPDTLISIDSYNAKTANAALNAGAHIINDVWGLQRDPELADVAANHTAPTIIMHWDTARNADKDIISEIKRYFDTSLTIAEKAGIARERIILDPGFGFAKTLAENYTILNRLDELSAIGLPLLIGTSRKSMIGKILDIEPKERLAGTIATNVLAYAKGGHIFRVHDVKENAHALKIAQATLYGPTGQQT